MTISALENSNATTGKALVLATLGAPGFTWTGGAGAVAAASMVAAATGGDAVFWSVLTGFPKSRFSGAAAKFIFAGGNQHPLPGATGMEVHSGPGGVRWRTWKESNGQRVIRVHSYNAPGLTSATIAAGNSFLAAGAASTFQGVTSGLSQGPIGSAGTGFVDAAGNAVETGAETAATFIGGAMMMGQGLYSAILGPVAPSPDFTFSPVEIPPPPPPPPSTPLLPLAALAALAFFL